MNGGDDTSTSKVGAASFQWRTLREEEPRAEGRYPRFRW
jgi:hypothetical protein